MPKIEDDSLCLSGETGTKLKTEIIERYYRFWLGVVTGGTRGSYAQKVHIIELNAGTGQVKIEGTGETILGSAGHALDLRYGKYGNEKLHIILIEPHEGCRQSLRNVILKRWNKAQLHPHQSGWDQSTDEAVNLFESSDLFLKYISLSDLGNSLFFFDPLLAPDQSLVEEIALSRVSTPFKTGTEFLIFFFTSDWVIGRKDFAALPKTKSRSKWTLAEKKSAGIADRVFGNRRWTEIVSGNGEKAKIEDDLVNLYKQTLRRWFRYVQPLPFVPKDGQRYDVFCCSNYDVGMKVISKIYGNLTWPFGLQADIKKNREAYSRFVILHPGIDNGLRGNARPPEWKTLWHMMRNHIDGICDSNCKGGIIDSLDNRKLDKILNWLLEQGYIKRIDAKFWPWSKSAQFPAFKIDWLIVKSRLDVDPPIPPRALEPGDLDKVRVQLQRDNEQEDQTSLNDFF